MFPLPLLWLIACFVLQLAFAVRGAEPLSDAVCWAWIGSMWAGWAACVWMSSSIRNICLKFAFLAVAGGWHAEWMALIREMPIVRYVIMFGGYAVIQSTLFRFFRIPDWSFETLRLMPMGAGRRQFSILELLTLMTITALLITAAKRYEPPSGQVFWYGSLVVYIALAVTATLCSLAIVAPKRFDRRMFAASTVAAILLGSAAMACLDSKFNTNFMKSEFREAMKYLWPPYFCICGAFAMSLIVLAACGRMHFNVKTEDPPNSDDDESPPSDDLLPFRQPPRT